MTTSRDSLPASPEKPLPDRIILELRDIRKAFGAAEVLRGVSLPVREGEFVTLLGSSGCGKTTMLRIIAGLETPDSGEVILEGESMAGKPPEKRGVNTVFQNYALFPHMNVYQNIAYSLRIRGADKQRIARRVGEMLELVRMEGSEKKLPGQLSGGQRQRIAIARALINTPRVLLLDEPLGALDLQLRRQMQLELKRLQKQLGTTFIYVTHDQEEAINMSDRIVVLHNGLIEQQGSPNEIYDEPRTGYVARFIGSANVLSGTAEDVSGGFATVRSACGLMRCRAGRGTPPAPGARVCLAVRGENIRISGESEGAEQLAGTLQERSYAGGMLRLSVLLDDGSEVVVRRHGINFDLSAGQRVYLDWPAASAVLVEGEEQP